MSLQDQTLQSFMIFGGVDENQKVGEFYEHDVETEKWWGLRMSVIQYDKDEVSNYMMNQKNVTALIDTGSSLILLPKFEYNGVMDRIKQDLKKHNETLYCEGGLCWAQQTCKIMKDMIGNLSFTIDDTIYTLKPMAYLFEGALLDRDLVGSCMIGINALPKTAPDDVMLLGITFLRNFYTVFNMEENSVKLAINVNS